MLGAAEWLFSFCSYPIYIDFAAADFFPLSGATIAVFKKVII